MNTLPMVSEEDFKKVLEQVQKDREERIRKMEGRDK